jgi:hypothetical protein
MYSQIPAQGGGKLAIRKHGNGIVACRKARLNNGAAEALDGIILSVKRKSRGFCTVRHFTTMIDLVASRLGFDLPDLLPSTHTQPH